MQIPPVQRESWLNLSQYGISVWDGILCNFFGYLLISFFMVLCGRAGAVYHVSPKRHPPGPCTDILAQIGFPVFCRSSFGIYGAAWPVFNRALSACVWNGVNTVTGEA